jgi:hypothetical protein
MATAGIRVRTEPGGVRRLPQTDFSTKVWLILSLLVNLINGMNDVP